jgi:hypothetical protein
MLVYPGHDGEASNNKAGMRVIRMPALLFSHSLKLFI